MAHIETMFNVGDKVFVLARGGYSEISCPTCGIRKPIRDNDVRYQDIEVGGIDITVTSDAGVCIAYVDACRLQDSFVQSDCFATEFEARAEMEIRTQEEK